MFIEKAAYSSLEISKVMELVSRRCRSEIGALVARNIAPAFDMAELKRRQALYMDVERYRGYKGELPWINDIVSVALCLRWWRRMACSPARSW